MMQDLRRAACSIMHAYAVSRQLSDLRILFDVIEISIQPSIFDNTLETPLLDNLKEELPVR